MPKLIHRKLMDNLLSGLDKKFISVLIGPRQVGKTTLLKMLIQEIKNRTHKKIIYLNLDDITIRARFSQDPTELQREIERRIGKPRPVPTSLLLSYVSKWGDVKYQQHS